VVEEDLKVHMSHSNHGTGNVFLASNASEAESARATSLGRRLSVDAKQTDLDPSTTWPCRFSVTGQMQIVTSSNSNSPMPLGSPLVLVNKHNLRQARSTLFRTQKNRADFSISTISHWIVISRVRRI
jgi:hypothetical protein